MQNDRKAVVALSRLAKDYPHGVKSLFTGHLATVKPTGRNLAAALRRGDISFDGLYDVTLGSYDNLSGNSLAMKAATYNAQQASKPAEKSKFTNILGGLLGLADQAADVYGKFKNPQTADGTGTTPQAQTDGGKKTPWLFIGGAAVVVILVIVLLVLKKK